MYSIHTLYCITNYILPKIIIRFDKTVDVAVFDWRSHYPTDNGISEGKKINTLRGNKFTKLMTLDKTFFLT